MGFDAKSDKFWDNPFKKISEPLIPINVERAKSKIAIPIQDERLRTGVVSLFFEAYFRNKFSPIHSDIEGKESVSLSLKHQSLNWGRLSIILLFTSLRNVSADHDIPSASLISIQKQLNSCLPNWFCMWSTIFE